MYSRLVSDILSVSAMKHRWIIYWIICSYLGTPTSPQKKFLWSLHLWRRLFLSPGFVLNKLTLHKVESQTHLQPWAHSSLAFPLRTRASAHSVFLRTEARFNITCLPVHDGAAMFTCTHANVHFDVLLCPEISHSSWSLFFHLLYKPLVLLWTNCCYLFCLSCYWSSQTWV